MIEYSDKAVAVVVNSGDTNGYGVISNLGMHGIPVLSVDSNPKNITFYSKYARNILCPDYEVSEELFIQFLLDLGKKLRPKPVLFITGDLQLLTVLKHQDKLETFYHMPMASLNVVEKLVDKVAFYKILDELKLPYAQTYVPQSISEAESLGEKLNYPYIIKPVQSKFFSKKFGNKCLEAKDKEEFVDQYKRVAQEEDKIIVQKRIEGSERFLVYTYFNRQSRPLAVCCYKKERIIPIDYGNACMCKLNWNPEAIKLCLDLLKKIKYHGLAEAEIQRDTCDGQLKLVEINARTTTEARLSAKCGLNMEYIAYKDIQGIDISLKPLKIKNLKWIDCLRDVVSVFSSEGYWVNGKITIRQWLNSLKGEKEFAYFNLKDPLPFCIAFFRFFKIYVLKQN